MRAAPIVLLLAPALLLAQGKGVAPEELLKPLQNSWPTYNGDYTGKRYSSLQQIDPATAEAAVVSGPGSVAEQTTRIRCEKGG